MHQNAFGDRYCGTVDEIVTAIDNRNLEVHEVHLAIIDEPEEPGEKWSGEVAENVSGGTVCYIEADSRDAVKALAKEVGIEDCAA